MQLTPLLSLCPDAPLVGQASRLSEMSRCIGRNETLCYTCLVQNGRGRGLRSLLRLISFCATLAALLGCKPEASKPSTPNKPELITFTGHIAPILFQHCASCHRPDQSAPFSLLSYDDARKHAQEIVEVTTKRYMTPWPPEPGFGEFLGKRGLSAEQIETIE